MPNWTQQQLDAITDRGHSLIVCAAAGSGKTAVLVERIVQLVKEGCPIEQMLVVTFTNAAAGEMRLRIGEALGLAAQERPELGEQVMALSRASISTLHRFCGNLLREHFQALGIDPAFRIADDQECGVLAQQAMEDALYSCYEVGSAEFMAADACYEQETLADLARQMHAFMMTRPDPWDWLERAADNCAQQPEELENGAAVQLLLDDAKEQIGQLIGLAVEGGPGDLTAIALAGGSLDEGKLPPGQLTLVFGLGIDLGESNVIGVQLGIALQNFGNGHLFLLFFQLKYSV